MTSNTLGRDRRFHQAQLGKPIDKNLSADMRRYESRYEQARRGLALIMELGDF